MIQTNYRGAGFKNRVTPKSSEYSHSTEYITENDIKSFSKIVVKRNGSVHSLLLFSRFHSKNNPNDPITFQDIDQLNPKLFSVRSKLTAALKKLDKHGLIDYDHEAKTWEMTPKGTRFLYYFAEKNVKNTN